MSAINLDTKFKLLQGPMKLGKREAFFECSQYPHLVLDFADGVKIFPRDYLLALFIILAKSTLRALAIFRQVMRVGLRLLFSTKLMVARLRPVISANVSCDTPFSLRTFINSAITLTASFSDTLSLIGKDSQVLADNFIRNYSKE